MGKRKAGDEPPPPAAAAAGAAAPRAPPVLVTSRRRARALQQEVRWLNASFADFVSSRRDASVTLDTAAEDYLRFWAELREKYRDVLQPAAAAAEQARRRGGAVYMVGSGDFAQLGLGEDVAECARPFPLDAFGGLLVTALACGGLHTLTLTEDGGVWSWGVNDEGPLGRVVRRARASPGSVSRRAHVLASALKPSPELPCIRLLSLARSCPRTWTLRARRTRRGGCPSACPCPPA
jgi:hypothetical protein